MELVITSEAMRLWEQANFASQLADPIELMYIAGSGCTEYFLEFSSRYRNFRRVVIFAGHGNNGGDGVVMASLLAEKLEAEVVLALAMEPEKLSAASRFYFEKLPGRVKVMLAKEVVINKYDLIVDALLGTGCFQPVREPYKSLIARINQSKQPVFAVDLASGLGADVAVKAGMTAAIGAFKDILFTEEGTENSGLLRKVDLPLELAPENNSDIFAASLQWYRSTMPELPRNVHKYQRGSVLVVGGSREYFQAPYLTARSALRGGAGLVRLLVPFAVQPGSGCLSVIPVGIAAENGAFDQKSLEYVKANSEKANCIAAGPGMGRNLCTKEFIAGLMAMEKPLLLDADALFFAAQMPELFRSRRYPTILTPHWGEAQTLARGAGITFNGDKIAFARHLAQAYNSITVLKGARTLIAEPDNKVWINTSGTPALATAGSGDVLTGLIAAEIAGLGNETSSGKVMQAICRGVFLHGLAGELAQERFGETGAVADDLPELAAECNSKVKFFL